MKKIFACLLCTLVSFALFAVEAEIVELSGKAEIQINGVWKEAAKGGVIPAGSVVSTGFKSSLTLKIDGSTLVVNQLTRLKLEEILQKEDAVSSKVFLDTGRMKVDVKPKTTAKVNFQVQTPVATASVRGTAGEITASGQLSGSEGTWSYTAGNQTLYVPSGSTVIIDTNGAAITPQEVLTAQAAIPETGIASSINAIMMSDTVDVGPNSQPDIDVPTPMPVPDAPEAQSPTITIVW